MRRTTLQMITLFVMFVVFISAAVGIQHRTLEGVRKNPPFLETWNLSGRSGEILKWLSLRYDMVMADFLWLRAIQSFGGRGMTNRDYKPIYNLFDTITELDPYFEEAYTFGNMVIGDEGGRQKEGLDLINKGMEKGIYRYRTPFEGLYVAFWQMNDPKLARWYGRIAAKRLDAPDWVPRIAAYVEVAAGAYYVGLDKYVGNLLRGIDAKEPAMTYVALNKIKDTINDWNKSLLLKAYDEYTSLTGKVPSSLDDLTSMPALTNYEAGSMSRLLGTLQRYLLATGRDLLDPEMLKFYPAPSPAEANKPVGEKERAVRNMSELQNEVFRSTLEKRSGLPQPAGKSKYHLNRANAGYPFGKHSDTVMTEDEMEEFTRGLLMAVRGEIGKAKTLLDRTPESLKEVFSTDFKTTEPYGGKFTYDPKTGDFKSSTHPDW